MFYATTDAEDGRILQDAHVAAFDTLDDAREYLLRAFDPAEWDMSAITLEPGRYGDCWIKTINEPRADISDDRWLSPFSLADVSVQRPGQHPGGKFYWITPDLEVLTVHNLVSL